MENDLLLLLELNNRKMNKKQSSSPTYLPIILNHSSNSCYNKNLSIANPHANVESPA